MQETGSVIARLLILVFTAATAANVATAATATDEQQHKRKAAVHYH